MILKNAIYKGKDISINRTTVSHQEFIHMVISAMYRGERTSCDVLFDLFNQNLIIPLDLGRISHFNKTKDTQGCRIYDWKILCHDQIKTVMKMTGGYDRVRIPHYPATAMFASIIKDDSMPNIDTFEEYNKMLNVTYLVDDVFLTNWLDPAHEEENVAKKQVQDCSVKELLFAIKRKLK